MGNHELKIELDGWKYVINENALDCLRGGALHMSIPLCPDAGKKAFKIRQWKQENKNSITGIIGTGNTVRVAVEHGLLCLSMKTTAKCFEKITTLPGITFSGEYWQTFMSDEHDRKWNVQLDQEVGISSAYGPSDNPFRIGWDGGGMTDPGDLPPYWIFNIPVRAFALQTKAGWTGFLIPGALPVGLTRLAMHRGKLSVSFEELRPSCCSGEMPKIYIVPGLSDPYDTLTEYRHISDKLGLTVEKSTDHPSWWVNPFYNYWDEYCREGYAPPTAKKYLDWLNVTREKIGIRQLNVTLEQGCFDYYGSYLPIPELGGVEGMRAMVDRLREEGTRMAHYVNPYPVNTKCQFWKDHPEAFCKPKPGAEVPAWPLDDGDQENTNVQLDWTHPLAREFMADRLRFIFSSEPGCLNCDIVRSNNWVTPDPRKFSFYDPDWGIGDMMTMKVQKFIYETAKAIKPDIMVTKMSAADPYIHPWLDGVYMCEDWTSYTSCWYRRGRIITRTMPELLKLTDAWFVTITKGYEFYMGMHAWNIPETDSVAHTIHPYQTYRPLEAKDFKRRKAGFHVYANAPQRQGDLSWVDISDDGEVVQWRKHVSGPLTGFYAAIGIDKRTLVTYSESEARIATSVARTVDIPLPAGAKVISVTVLSHQGVESPWAWEPIILNGESGMRIYLEDCGEEAFYYRIKYVIQ